MMKSRSKRVSSDAFMPSFRSVRWPSDSVWLTLYHAEKSVANLTSVQKTRYKQLTEIETITKIYRQQRKHHESGNAKESIPNRIESVNKPYVCPIVRGKEVKKVEFGAKCNNILVDGLSFIEKLSFNAFNEGTRLVHCVNLAEKLFGEKITKQAGDCSYSGKANCSFCSEQNIVTSFSQKGRKKETTFSVRMLKKELARVRATAMEGSFGTQKGHYGLNRINGQSRRRKSWSSFSASTRLMQYNWQEELQKRNSVRLHNHV